MGNSNVGEVKQKREWCYVQPPSHFEMSACSCGNNDTQWSEFIGHLWCSQCKTDFIPEHAGVLDGPVPVNVAALLGIDFRTYKIETPE